ncbi:myosin light chain 5 [Homo sapiens]|uniref:Myosin light chain 5 n=2 Tax=Homo sapiens TaxID=9606 RepID=D6RA88_HUMAN|nr:myosin light chain 5 [Homo sapiens]KAI4024470.1 myosin light chain 5 [Homo sapiens]
MASRKTKKKEGGALRAQRASSNVFSNFEQTQIQEFKEAFTLMDQNRDGFIDKEDLKDTYASLGRYPGRTPQSPWRRRTQRSSSSRRRGPSSNGARARASEAHQRP